MSKDFPPELEDACKKFELAMRNVENSIEPLLKTERSELLRTSTSLDAAKIDLVSVFAINSFYWAYLVMQGIDPKKHTVKTEIDRIRSLMSKLEEIKNRKNRPTLSKDAAKRFVRNAMFKAKEADQQNDLKQDNLNLDDSTNSVNNHSAKQLKRKSTKVYESGKRFKKA